MASCDRRDGGMLSPLRGAYDCRYGVRAIAATMRAQICRDGLKDRRDDEYGIAAKALGAAVNCGGDRGT